MKESLIEAFSKLKLFQKLVKSAVVACNRAGHFQMREFIGFSGSGLVVSDNQCMKCKQPLIPQAQLKLFLDNLNMNEVC